MALPPGVPDYGYRPSFDDEKDNSLVQKAKDNPMFPIGIACGLGALVYSAKKFKDRGSTKVSVYLIHTRLVAQGAVVGAVTLGVLYSMYQEYFKGGVDQNKTSIRKT